MKLPEWLKTKRRKELERKDLQQSEIASSVEKAMQEPSTEVEND